MEKVTGVKVFSATKAREREGLGDIMTAWLRSKYQKNGFELLDVVITQSSDSEFHCYSATFFYHESVA